MDVDGAGAAEVVVAPHLLQQLLAAEDAAGVLGQELQELELLEGQVQRALADLGGVGGVVDDDLAGADDVGVGVGGVAGCAEAADGELDAGLELGGAAGVQHDVVHAPVVGDDGQAALGGDEEDGDLGAGGADQPAQVTGVGEVLATVDEEEVGLGRLEEGASLGGQDLDVVAEQRETGQDLGGRLERAGQQQKGAHTGLLPWGVGGDRNATLGSGR